MKRRDLKKFIRGTGSREFSAAVCMLRDEKKTACYCEGRRGDLIQVLLGAGLQDEDVRDMLIEVGTVLKIATYKNGAKEGEGDNKEEEKG